MLPPRMTRPEPVQSILRDYLLGDITGAHALVKLGGLAAERPDDGLVRYLYARRLEAAGAYREALGETRAALAAGLPDPLFEAEAGRMLGRQLLEAGQLGAAREHYLGLARTATRAVDALQAQDWAERAALMAESAGSAPE